MDHDITRIRQLSEDMMGLMSVAENMVQATYLQVCGALHEREEEIRQLQRRVAQLEAELANQTSADSGRVLSSPPPLVSADESDWLNGRACDSNNA